MDKKKIVSITIILTIGLLLSGCWDKVEINDRAFVSTVGIDKHIGTEEANKEAEEESGVEGMNRYAITYTFPNIEAKGKGGKGDPVFLVTSVGISPYLTTRQLGTRLNQVMFFQHMKVLVIGEEVARNSEMMKEILDSIERNNQINRKVDVLIAKGKAKEVLSVKSKFEPDIGVYLDSISEGAGGTARFNPLTLGDLLESLHEDKNTLMPRIVAGEEDVKIAGSAVIKGFALVGWLGEIENRSAMLLKNELKSGTIAIIREKDKIIMPYTITKSTTKKKASMKEGKIKVEFMMEMEGNLEQSKLDTKESVLDDKVLQDIEKEINTHLENQIMKTVHKLQKEFKVDVIGVGDYLSKFKPDIWKDVEKDWVNIFPDIKIDVSVDAKIRRIGLSK